MKRVARQARRQGEKENEGVMTSGGEGGRRRRNGKERGLFTAQEGAGRAAAPTLARIATAAKVEVAA